MGRESAWPTVARTCMLTGCLLCCPFFLWVLHLPNGLAVHHVQLYVQGGASACSTAAGKLNAYLAASPCSKGQYFDSSFNCQACPANTYQSTSSHKSATCLPQPSCGIGEKISADTKTAQRTCSSCSANTFQTSPSHRTTTCATQATCGKGEKISADTKTAQRTCSPCPPFTFQPSDSHHDTECATADVSTCSDAGNFDFTNGTCVCNTNDPSVGGIGPACAHTNALNCNNVGTAQADGSCVCDSPATGLGPTCSEFTKRLKLQRPSHRQT